MAAHLLFLSVPGLRPRDVNRAATPTIHEWANRGTLQEMSPTFPCVTSCVQASMMTGEGPGRHGIIANGFYHRDRCEVEMWTGSNDLVSAPQIWGWLRSKQLTSAAWHAQNIKGAAADFIVTPAPIHESDGSMKLWCYSKPDGLYQELLDSLGHFPLQHYWGPLSNIESTRWILRGAAWLMERQAPNFHWIYLPHLDYASQKFGPDSPQAQTALVDLDRELADFATRVAASPNGKDVVYLVAGEYAITEVTGVVYPNRILREAGLLSVAERDGTEHLDLGASAAFAMVDHQFAHVFLRREGTKAEDHKRMERVAGCFRGLPGLVGVHAGDDRARVGMTHQRCGDIVLVCDDAHWLAYYWWLDDALAPPFARTVDIHRKPGYDPVELFFDPKTRGISLDTSLVKGSHGVPVSAARHRTAVVCSKALPRTAAGRSFQDTDMLALVQDLMSQ